MSDPQTSPPPQPLEYFVPSQPPRQRPASVTVISVLAILIGTVGALNVRSANIAILGLRSSWPMWFFLLDHLVSGILGVILVVGGILALVLKPLGRRLLLFYALAHLLTGLAGAILEFSIVMSLLAQPRPPPIPAPTTGVSNVNIVIHANVNFHSAKRFGWLTIIPSVVAVIVWSSIIIYVMTRPRVKAVFEFQSILSDREK